MINSIQVLRGISILLVVLYHVTAITDDAKSQYYFDYGKIGVDIFFIISGYIMTFICERNEPTAPFIKKRIIRIMPLYISVTLLAALANYRGDLLNGSEYVWTSLVKSIFMVPHYSIANESKIFPIFIPGWTITYEIWFYTSIALVGLLFKYPKKTLIVPYVLSFIYIASQALPEGAIKGFTGNSVYLTFALGMLIRMYETKKIEVKYLVPSVLYLFILAFVFEQESARFITLGLPAFGIFLVFFFWIGDRLGSMAYIGKISFSLYLTHVFAINIVERLMRSFYPNISYGLELMMVIAFFASIVVAVITHIVFEKRLDNALRKIFL